MSHKIDFTKKQAIAKINTLGLDLSNDVKYSERLQELKIGEPTGQYKIKKYLFGLIKIKTPIKKSQCGYDLYIKSCPIDKELTFKVFKTDWCEHEYFGGDHRYTCNYTFKHSLLKKHL